MEGASLASPSQQSEQSPAQSRLTNDLKRDNAMTPDERKMLSDLADKVAQTPAPPRDPDAEDFIRTRIGNRPDALYLMTQTVLVQNLALQQAQQQIQALQRGGGSSSAGSGSFLGQGGPSGSSFSQSSGQGQYSAPPQYSSQPQYAQASTPSPAAGAAPSFLRGAAQTAAGVAAGALAFEGIRSLFSHPGYGLGSTGFGGGYGLGGGAPVEETVVNNYYDNAGGNDAGNFDLRDNRDNFSDAGQLDNADYTDNSSDLGSSDFGGFDDGGDNFS